MLRNIPASRGKSFKKRVFGKNCLPSLPAETAAAKKMIPGFQRSIVADLA
jgi:hypothetical protein